MQLGDCFVPRGANDHLQVVISDPAKNATRVLLVSITTVTEYKEQVCLFNANEHQWIRHQSCVAFNYARLVTNEALEKLRAEGVLEMYPPFSHLLLKRIWRGAEDSTELKDNFADLLIEQGFIDL